MAKFNKTRSEKDQTSYYRWRSQNFPNLLHHESHSDAVHLVCPSHQEGAGLSDHQIQWKKAHKVLSVVAGRQPGDLYDVLGYVE